MVLQSFISYLDDDDDDDDDDEDDNDDVIRSLFIILPQMIRYIKYFDGAGKYMSFRIEHEGVYLKYNEIWNKKTLNIRLHSQPIYDDKYIKNQEKTFNCVINTVFENN